MTLVFVDTETTSLRDDRRAWEIAMIRRLDGGGTHRMLLHVSDVSMAEADPASLKFGGFYERHGRYGTPPNDARSRVESKAAILVESWTRGAHLVGVNPSFDAITLSTMLGRHGLVPAWRYHLLDVSAMAVGWLAGRGEAPAFPWKSDALSRACGVDPGVERHTAMGDAEWTMRWYDAMVGGAA